MANESKYRQNLMYNCSRSTSPPEFQYYIDNETLTCTNQHLYLGVLFHSLMSFSPHINNITSSAIKSLNFVRHNLNKCDESVKSTAYLGLFWPKLEYASLIWDPIYLKTFKLLRGYRELLLDG